MRQIPAANKWGPLTNINFCRSWMTETTVLVFPEANYTSVSFVFLFSYASWVNCMTCECSLDCVDVGSTSGATRFQLQVVVDDSCFPIIHLILHVYHIARWSGPNSQQSRPWYRCPRGACTFAFIDTTTNHGSPLRPASWPYALQEYCVSVGIWGLRSSIRRIVISLENQLPFYSARNIS